MAAQHPNPQRLNEVIITLKAGSTSLNFGRLEFPGDAKEFEQIALVVARPGSEGGYQVNSAWDEWSQSGTAFHPQISIRRFRIKHDR